MAVGKSSPLGSTSMSSSIAEDDRSLSTYYSHRKVKYTKLHSILSHLLFSIIWSTRTSTGGLTCSYTPCRALSFFSHMVKTNSGFCLESRGTSEFCARVFHTNSRFLIHCRREKPVQWVFSVIATALKDYFSVSFILKVYSKLVWHMCCGPYECPSVYPFASPLFLSPSLPGVRCVAPPAVRRPHFNWHMKNNNIDDSYQFPCKVCGWYLEKSYNLTARSVAGTWRRVTTAKATPD